MRWMALWLAAWMGALTVSCYFACKYEPPSQPTTPLDHFGIVLTVIVYFSTWALIIAALVGAP